MWTLFHLFTFSVSYGYYHFNYRVAVISVYYPSRFDYRITNIGLLFPKSRFQLAVSIAMYDSCLVIYMTCSGKVKHSMRHYVTNM